MPMIDADGCLLNVSVEGRSNGPTLMLSNSLGCTLQMWEPQMKALTQVFRVIRYDRRGHGKSSVPPGPGPDHSPARAGRAYAWTQFRMGSRFLGRRRRCR